MDPKSTSHISTLFLTVSGCQPGAQVSHRTLRLLGESATSASTRPKSACRNVKHKRRCRLHLFRGPRPTTFFSFPFFSSPDLTVPTDSPHKKTASPFVASGSSQELTAHGLLHPSIGP